MSLLTVEGIYRDGKVELSERPESVKDAARVIVTLLPAEVPIPEAAPGTDADREALRERAFARMRQGMDLGGPPYPKREELYDRFDR